MIGRITAILTVLLAWPATSAEQAPAQAGRVTQLRSVTSPDSEYAAGQLRLEVLSMNSDGLYAAGRHLLLFRHDATVAWAHDLNCKADAVHALPDGGAIVLARDCRIAGDVSGAEILVSDPVLFHVNSRGTLVWTRIIRSEAELGLNSVTSASDGAIYVVGTSVRPGKRSRSNQNWHDMLLIKLDQNAEPLWSYQLRADQSATAVGLSIGSDDRPVVAAYQGLVAQFDSAGKLIWSRRYRREPNRRISVVGITRSGTGLILAGKTSTLDRSGRNVFAITISGHGTIRSAQLIDGGLIDNIDQVASDGSGGMLLAGSTHRAGTTLEDKVHRRDGWLVRVDADGSILGSVTIGRELDDHLNDAAGIESMIAAVGNAAPDKASTLITNPFHASMGACPEVNRLPATTRQMAVSSVDVPSGMRKLDIKTIPVDINLTPVKIEVTTRCSGSEQK